MVVFSFLSPLIKFLGDVGHIPHALPWVSVLTLLTQPGSEGRGDLRLQTLMKNVILLAEEELYFLFHYQ